MDVVLPSVLIVTTIYSGKEYCLDKFVEQAKGLTYPNKRHIFIDNSPTPEFSEKLKAMGLEVYHVDRGNNSREALARSSNLGRRLAIEGNYDYMFSLESDVFGPPDMIQRLLRRGKDVISGVYHIGDKSKGQRVPCITIFKYDESVGMYGTTLLAPTEWPEWKDKGVKACAAGSFGCCMIHKNVFKNIVFHYDTRLKGHPDIFFFNDCFRNNIPVYVDTDLYMDHENIPWSQVNDR